MLMTEQEAFLHAILDAPDGDAPRLIYADWLEEHYDLDPRGRRLHVNDDEAARVRAIFALYLEHQSLLPVVQELHLWLVGAASVRGVAHARARRPVFLPVERVDGSGTHSGGDNPAGEASFAPTVPALT
jgi:uncharacterized protein (TIGR02996 family)